MASLTPSKFLVTRDGKGALDPDIPVCVCDNAKQALEMYEDIGKWEAVEGSGDQWRCEDKDGRIWRITRVDYCSRRARR